MEATLRWVPSMRTRIITYCALAHVLAVIGFETWCGFVGGRAKSEGVMALHASMIVLGCTIAIAAGAECVILLLRRMRGRSLKQALLLLLVVAVTVGTCQTYRWGRNDVELVRTSHVMQQALRKFVAEHGGLLPDGFDALVSQGYLARDNKGALLWLAGKCVDDIGIKQP